MRAYAFAWGDWDSLREELARQGFAVERTGGGHWRAKPPDKTKSIVVFSNHSGDRNTFENVISQLRRSGFVPTGLPEPKPKPVLAEVRSIVPAPPVSVSPSPPSLDKLFANLKEARSIAAMAQEELEAKREALERAKRELDAAQKERDEARAEMDRARKAFDEELARGGGP